MRGKSRHVDESDLPITCSMHAMMLHIYIHIYRPFITCSQGINFTSLTSKLSGPHLPLPLMTHSLKNGGEKLEVAQVEMVSLNGKEVDTEAVYIDPVAEKKLLRKVDLHVLPPLALLFMLAFLDRTNIGRSLFLDSLATTVA